MKDHWTKNRQAWVEGVSPFYMYEMRASYLLAWVLNLVFGIKMPHERR